MSVILYTCPAEFLVRDFTHALTTTLLQYKNKKVLLLLSGGSLFSIYPHLSKHLFTHATKDFSHFVIGVLDERYDNIGSNYRQLQENSFGKELANMHIPFIHPPNFSEPPQDVAQELDVEIKEYLNTGYTLIITLGMGPDGHTAGIMPFPEDTVYFQKTFVNTKRYVTYYHAADKNEFPQRITATIPLLSRAKIAFAYVSGISKKEKLTEALKSKEKVLAELPFSIIYHMTTVKVFTDIIL